MSSLEMLFVFHSSFDMFRPEPFSLFPSLSIYICSFCDALLTCWPPSLGLIAILHQIGVLRGVAWTDLNNCGDRLSFQFIDKFAFRTVWGGNSNKLVKKGLSGTDGQRWGTSFSTGMILTQLVTVMVWYDIVIYIVCVYIYIWCHS